MRDTEREAETQAEGEAGSLWRPQCGTWSQDPRIMIWPKGRCFNHWATQASLTFTLKGISETGEIYQFHDSQEVQGWRMWSYQRSQHCSGYVRICPEQKNSDFISEYWKEDEQNQHFIAFRITMAVCKIALREKQEGKTRRPLGVITISRQEVMVVQTLYGSVHINSCRTYCGSEARVLSRC